MIENKIQKTTTVDYYDKELYYFDILCICKTKQKKKSISIFVILTTVL